MNSPVCSIFFHNYYGKHDEWIKFFSQNLTVPFNLFYNIVSNSPYNLSHEEMPASQLQETVTTGNLNQIIVRQSPNQGKDIGGKLILLDTYLRLGINTDLLVFFHDKKSPQEVQGFEWSQKLFRILKSDFITKALDLFNHNKDIAVVAAENSIQNEFDTELNALAGNNSQNIQQQQSRYLIDTPKYDYVAGTMFWARAKPYVDFFLENKPLTIREILEAGNVLDEKTGTYTHAWERLLTWIAFSRGYTIKGVQ